MSAWLAGGWARKSGLDAYVEVARPLQDGGIVLLGLAQQGGLLVLRLHRVSIVIQEAGGMKLQRGRSVL